MVVIKIKLHRSSTTDRSSVGNASSYLNLNEYCIKLGTAHESNISE